MSSGLPAGLQEASSPSVKSIARSSDKKHLNFFMTYSILSALAEYSEPGVVKMLYCENVTFGRYTAIIILSYYTITFILCQWIEKAKNKII